MTIPQSTLYKVVEWLTCQFEVVLPSQTQLPAIGTHIGIVALRSAVAVYGRQLIANNIHIGCVLAINIEAQIEPVFEEVEIYTKIVGSYLLPSQTLRSWGRSIGISNEVAILYHITLVHRHGREILIWTDKTITCLTDRETELQIVEELVTQILHPRFLRNAPSHRTGREETPLLIGRKFGTSVITTTEFCQITALEIIVQAIEITQERPFIAAVILNIIAVSINQIEVWLVLYQQSLTHDAGGFIIIVFDIPSRHNLHMMRITQLWSIG